MYYILNHDFKYPTPARVLIPKEWDKYDLFAGKKIRIEKPVPPIQLTFEQKVIPSDSIPSGDIFLFFSARLIEFVNRNISTKLFQSFPVEIRFTPPQTKTPDYSVINLVNLKDVINRDASDLILSKYGNISLIRRLKIKEEKAEGCDLFRMEGFIGLVVCSQLFADKMAEGGFTGMKLVPVNKFIG